MENFTAEQVEQVAIHDQMGYHQLHYRYHLAKADVDAATTPEDTEAALYIFRPVQYAFLTNRQKAVPTECYQIIASFLDRDSRVQLGQCDHHLHDQVLYGPNSARFVWREGRVRVEQLQQQTVPFPSGI